MNIHACQRSPEVYMLSFLYCSIWGAKNVNEHSYNLIDHFIMIRCNISIGLSGNLECH